MVIFYMESLRTFTDILLDHVAPQIQNAVVENELMVYGILGFIKLQAGIEPHKHIVSA